MARGILAGLDFHATQGDILFPGFDDTSGSAAGIQQTACKAVAALEGKFADGDTARGVAN
ncbi:MAG: hypothetical protein L3K24_17115 [Gammaproteobacteria bacterium]|nr:hypothetical protein [Gammaproteobacteria bacterium]